MRVATLMSKVGMRQAKIKPVKEGGRERRKRGRERERQTVLIYHWLRAGV